VFILTHNVYFYKEVTFKGLRENNSNDESFWVIKKSNMMSSISRYKENPIKTSYELLWRQLDEYDTLNTQSVFNAMRRILEYYFNIIGCIDYEKCIDEFEGYDKLICRSLLSFINDGSHTIFEDIHMSIETEQIDRYVKVFELLFEKMGHKNHYNMMRRLD
jgi:wobble nucleotide-excising tRNase